MISKDQINDSVVTWAENWRGEVDNMTYGDWEEDVLCELRNQLESAGHAIDWVEIAQWASEICQSILQNEKMLGPKYWLKIQLHVIP